MNYSKIFPSLIMALIGAYAITRIPFVQQSLIEYAKCSIEQKHGSAPLAPEYEAKVHTIAAELGIAEPIIIRKMNTNALQTFGYYNAFVTFADIGEILPVDSAPYLFISEGFFEDLSEEEQRFLLGHELTHAKEHRLLLQYENLIWGLSLLLLYALWWLFIRRKMRALVIAYIPEIYRQLTITSTNFLLIIAIIVGVNLINMHYRRHIEWEADHQSLVLLHSHEGGIQLMERWAKEYRVPLANPLGGLFSDHPSTYERRAYCLAHKQSITTEVSS